MTEYTHQTSEAAGRWLLALMNAAHEASSPAALRRSEAMSKSVYRRLRGPAPWRATMAVSYLSGAMSGYRMGIDHVRADCAERLREMW